MKKGSVLHRGIFLAISLMFGTSVLFADPPARSGEKRGAGEAQRERIENFKSKTPDELMSLLDADVDRPAVINRLRKSRDKRAIPGLKKAFANGKLPATRRAAAAAIVALGERDEKYWNFVAEPAKGAVERDAPFVTVSNGKERSPEFVAWCKKTGCDEKAATQEMLTDDPQNVLTLSMTEDARAVPMLMKGLRSKNSLVVGFSARGLAAIGHKPAIEQMVSTAEKNPSSALSIGKYLALFDDPGAQSAAKRFLGQESFDFLQKMSSDKRREFILGE